MKQVKHNTTKMNWIGDNGGLHVLLRCSSSTIARHSFFGTTLSGWCLECQTKHSEAVRTGSTGPSGWTRLVALATETYEQ